MRAGVAGMGLSRRALMGRMAVCAVLSGVATAPLAAQTGVAAMSPQVRSTASLLHVAFPHADLDAQFYARVAQDYLSEIDGSPGMAELERGLSLLDGSHIAAFANLPWPIQRSMVAKYDQEPFFKALLMRGAELIYRDKKVWDLVGYEGSSLEYGGYIDRGFDDIDWLPVTGDVN
ncbi:hypothetical protein [Croceicoccus gelatinilyticus]|uniref:hypothetical protein n=1 Tax=Croceicoccus gelatinilyticus TaxID=2835536 RepID=UPI001BCEA61E|nr:hypothetical protein [Croceicoccus gelatinilyticus]MBS7669409.1 hypothetical protein [Croceicoccus gelatinilyticus]